MSFLSVLESVGKDFAKGLGFAMTFAVPAEKLVSILLPSTMQGMSGVTSALTLIQNAVLLVEQKFAALGAQNGTGAQKLAEVVEVVDTLQAWDAVTERLLAAVSALEAAADRLAGLQVQASRDGLAERLAEAEATICSLKAGGDLAYEQCGDGDDGLELAGGREWADADGSGGDGFELQRELRGNDDGSEYVDVRAGRGELDDERRHGVASDGRVCAVSNGGGAERL